MSYKLAPLPNKFKRDGPLVLLVLDGYGLGKDDPNVNPIIKGNPKYFNNLIGFLSILYLYFQYFLISLSCYVANQYLFFPFVLVSKTTVKRSLYTNLFARTVLLSGFLLNLIWGIAK
jgi:hypothetical protein